MPYRSNRELPEQVKTALPEGAQDIFRNVVNAQLERGLAEHQAIASAWAAVKRTYEKGEGVKWVKIEKGGDSLEKTQAGTYVSMRVKNADQLREWFEGQGVKMMPSSELHTTISYSRTPFAFQPSSHVIEIHPLKILGVQSLGAEGAIVMKLQSDELQARFNACMSAGATYDYEEYIPHITLTYDGIGLDLNSLQMPPFPIVLYKETVEPLDLGFSPNIIKQVHIEKMGGDKRLVYAWAYVCQKDGEQVVDHSGDIMDEAEMEKMAYDFMESYRDGGERHQKTGVATAVASMPFTKDIQDALGIDTGKIGWFIVFKVHDNEVWEKVKNGTYKMLSIGGTATREKLI
jgi:cation transport regulator ChaB